ncbi:class I SAM-dependent methyltransferase [Herbidospora sp. NBRC 101105]|uniref:class I SAM-dependent methyltransferase n=1 Tax=Herbidospora sp. NBRC 101105 TaxID=3032195 RepID=UPI0024A05232|nr:class I SAM-dependent methyltransferase [Herbidospora sp. NBRC 101105]GLX96011.1 putative polyketide synthase protein [Herbidospora sp. NBRC 101105]
MDREKISLAGAQETMLATLWSRALDSRSPRSILKDEVAQQAVERIDYDFAKTGITPVMAAGVALRALRIDEWTRDFLRRHPTATVLHLACGLDTRAQRIDPGPLVRWIDLDYPEVLELRDRVIDRPDGDYHTIASSVTSEKWLGAVPDDRPTAVVFEGLSMYLREDDGRRLIERLTGRFATGELIFDCQNSTGIRLQKLNRPVRQTGATLHWAVDDPRVLESWHPGLTLLEAQRVVDMPGVEDYPLGGRVAMWIMARLPGFRNIGQILRYSWS